MKITFAGDWHGEADQALLVLKYAFQTHSFVIYQAGDFGIWDGDEAFLSSLDTALGWYNQTLYFVDGNHENFDRLYGYPIDEDTGLRPIRDNIYHIPRGWYGFIDPLQDGKLSLDNPHGVGISFLGLGGAYSVDQKWRKPGRSWWPQEVVTDEEISHAVSKGRADVLLMHDCPAPAPLLAVDDPFLVIQATKFFGVEAIDKANEHRSRLTPVLHSAQPLLLVHGHYHRYSTGLYKQPNSDILTQVLSLDEGSTSLYKHVMQFDIDGMI